MKIGVIADDFTGASDIALTLAEGGMRTMQFVGVPETATKDVQAGVISLKSRTAPVDEAISQSLAACDWLIAQGAEQIIFKVCSTFDSTSEGNIGPVADALAERLGAREVFVCPAFPENGRSVYQGHLFVADKLLNESGMQDHPLTPMTDPDLRRVMATQSSNPVGHIPLRLVTQGPAAVASAMADARQMTIVDAVFDNDLITIGAAAKNLRLIVGGSGIALGLPQNFGIERSIPSWPGIAGRAAILSGSCSRATRAQVDAYRAIGPSFEIGAEAAMAGSITAASLADWALSQDTAPLIYSSADPSVVSAAQSTYGKDIIASKIETLFRDLAAELTQRGVKRLIVAGGETSGAAVGGLAVDRFQIGPKLAAGVPALLIPERDIGLALKSGNFGGPAFFAEALAMMETAT